jgi:predicted alpha/beta-fold hydrolase
MFLNSLRPKALAKLRMNPGLFNREKMLAARDLYAFDNLYTAPVHGFRNTEDYWLRGSAKPHLHRIRIPALVLNARNDPFVPAWSLPRRSEVAKHVTLWQPERGGHNGFASGRFPGRLLATPQRVLHWLSSHGWA